MATSRRIFVGDIQGCLEPLERLLAAVAFVAGRDRLLPVGDLVNKGPDSPGVLARLMQLGAEPVLGNHDLHWLRKQRHADLAQRAWLQAQPIVRVMDDLIVVHAGLHPHWTEAQLAQLDAAAVDYAVNVRYCDADGNRPDDDWPPPGPPFRPWDDFYRGAKRVVFGHWARRGLVVRPQCIGLDTGCVYGGKLSAWIAEQDRIVQVDGWTPPATH
ncbi:MAG: metallophosphoesterase [Planctomycetes bacterium]|nr:metallophosphoesterase [Planctomycetota bacterium]